MTGVRTIIFAKAPYPGIAKTRLVPALGEAGAARVALQMLTATLEAAVGANVGPVELSMEPPPNAHEWLCANLPAGIQQSAQVEGDLGARLAHAAGRALLRQEAVLLIGTDCPEISSALLRAAARELQEFGSVIYPAADGGYALLGLTRFDSRLFEDIAWSTPSVAATTLARFQALEWPVHVGPTLYDVDVPEDLGRLPANGFPCEARKRR